jgi:hypothetical protein
VSTGGATTAQKWRISSDLPDEGLLIPFAPKVASRVDGDTRAVLELETDSRVTLLAAIIAGSVAVVGYLITQSANRRERKSKLYAEALSVVREYQELPYRVRRRPASDSVTRAELGEQISSVMTKLGFYLRWLQIDSHEVGVAYADLVEQVRRFGGPYRSKAWQESLIASDKDMPEVKYPYDADAEMRLCLLAMRRELSVFGLLFRRYTRRRLADQRKLRAEQYGGQTASSAAFRFFG